MFNLISRLVRGIGVVLLAILTIPMMIGGFIIVGILNAIRKSKSGL